jgi:hypothetical protein
MDKKHPSSKRYPPELKERACRLVTELRLEDHNAGWFSQTGRYRSMRDGRAGPSPPSARRVDRSSSRNSNYSHDFRHQPGEGRLRLDFRRSSDFQGTFTQVSGPRGVRTYSHHLHSECSRRYV